MSTITETMADDHRRCDALFTTAEEQASNGDWPAAADAFSRFRTATEHHFAMEEDVLFPEFEARTGQTMGPTQMMRMEHIQMRQLLSDMQQALEQQDRERYLGLSETLMMIMQQHNMKEERMLYPMTDQVFGDEATAVVERMNGVQNVA